MIQPLVLALLLVPQAPADSSADSRTSFYDLASLATADPDEEPLETWLLPFFHPQLVRDWSDARSEADDSSNEQELFDLLVELYPEEFEFEGRATELLADGRMMLRGPASVHQRVERVLGALEAFVNAGAELSIELVRVPARTELPARAVMPAGEVDGWLASLPGVRERVPLSVRADRAVRTELSTMRTLVMGYGTDLAEGSFLHDPLVVTAPFGTLITVAAAPRDGGLELALTLARGDQERVFEQDLGLSGQVLADGGFVRTPSTSVVQGYELANRSVSLTTFLPDGHALLLSTLSGDGPSELREVAVIRRTGGGLPRVAELELDARGSRLALVNTSFLSPVRASAHGRLLQPLDGNRTLTAWHESDPEGDSEPSLVARFDRDDGSFVLDALVGYSAYLSMQGLGPYTVFVSNEEDEGEGSGSLARVLAALDAAAGPCANVELSLALERADGDRVAAATVPVRAGASCSLVLGRERLQVLDYDGDVAQRAASPTPVTASVFDGLALWLRPRITPSGALVVDVRGTGSRAVDEEPFDLDGRLFDFVEQPVRDQLVLDERVSLGPRDGGRVVLGSAARGGERLRLVLEARW